MKPSDNIGILRDVFKQWSDGEVTETLNFEDIQRLTQNRSSEVRRDIAGKLSSILSAKVFNQREQQIASEILRLLMRDTEKEVRIAIAKGLKDSMMAPHDLVLQLAQDIEDVAVPVLKASYVLTEDDLIDIVRSTREVVKLKAIASRESVSSMLTEELIQTRHSEVLATLLANRGAVLEDQHLEDHWELLTHDKSLLQVLVHRGGLSSVIAEKLYAVVSDELKSVLSKKYKLAMIVVDDAADEAREWATLSMVSEDGSAPLLSEHELEVLINHLYFSNRLTSSILMRALCIGDLTFFEMALSRLADIPRVNVRILLFDEGDLGFRAIYNKAGLPEGFYDAIAALLRISLQETSHGRFRHKDFQQRVLARIQSQRLDRTIENMQYLLTIIGGKIATASTVH